MGGQKIIQPIPVEPKKSSVYSPGETAEIRAAAIQRAIGAQMDILTKCPTRTNLHDLSAVKEITEQYISRCGDAGVCPNFEGLCAALGISRKWGYQFLRQHGNEPTADYLNGIRLAMASLRISLAESKILDNATAIFILKNSDLGFTDKQEISLSETEPDKRDWGLSDEALTLKYLSDIPEE